MGSELGTDMAMAILSQQQRTWRVPFPTQKVVEEYIANKLSLSCVAGPSKGTQ